jgi:hypothetical protein
MDYKALAKKILILGLPITFSIIILAWLVRTVTHEEESIIPLPTSRITFPTAVPSPTVTPSVAPTPANQPSPTPTALPEEVNLNVPFTPQAPTANWDATHEETCEEASLLMAYWYVKEENGSASGRNKNLVPADKAEAKLMELVDWQKDTFGYFEDTTVAETVRIAKEKLGLTKVRVLNDVSANTLKQELAEGNVIVVPLAGQEVDNPYFKQPGPPYHMITLRGYNKSGFITNDPGTRNGESFIYKENDLLPAIHDWTGKDSTINEGTPRVIIIER